MLNKLLNKLKISKDNFKVVENFKFWIIPAGVILVIAVIIFSIFAGIGGSFSSGINIGLDFTGGASITVLYGEAADTDYNKCVAEVSQIIEENGFKVGYVQKTEENGIAGIMFRYQNNSNIEANDKIKNEILALYPSKVGDVDFISSQFIGATASNKLLNSAFLAVGVACLVILLYIVIRFEVWSGVAAILGLLHDVIMMILLTIIFQIQINTTFIAAIITIIAYSINNTIVIFDRVRENVKENKTKNISARSTNIDIVNKSVKDSLVRTVNTSFTTLITISILTIFGIASIREFALPIIFGLICGTYSSIFIAPSLYAIIKDAYDNRKHKKYSGKKIKVDSEAEKQSI